MVNETDSMEINLSNYVIINNLPAAIIQMNKFEYEIDSKKKTKHKIAIVLLVMECYLTHKQIYGL